MLFMIAVMKRDSDILGYRLLSTTTNGIVDVTRESLYYDILNGRKRLENIDIEDRCIKGSNGSLDRYPVLNQQLQLIGKSPVVILYKDKNGNYICSDYKGQVEKLSEHEILKYGKIEGIANGKVVGSSISSISGVYKSFESQHSIEKQIKNYKAKCKLIGLPNLTFEICGDEVVLIEVPKDIKKLIVPGFVTKIGAKLFNYNNTLETVLISEGLKVIGDWSFSTCSTLRKVSLPSTLEHIQNYAFMGCTRMENIEIPSGLKRIDPCAFDSCRSLVEINIPESVIRIGNNAFQHCESLRRIAIPGGIKNIEEYTFTDCVNLEYVDIKDGITSVDKYAFNGCRSLKAASLPSTLSIIGEGAFDVCESLENIILPENLSFIGDYAFEGCKSIKNIIIPNRTAFLGDNAFIGCSSIRNLRVPKKFRAAMKGSTCNYELC